MNSQEDIITKIWHHCAKHMSFFIRIIFFAKCKTFFISLNVILHDSPVFNWPMTTDKWNVFSTLCLKFHLLLFPYGIYSVFVSNNTLQWLMSLCSLTLHQQNFVGPFRMFYIFYYILIMQFLKFLWAAIFFK